jgi:hypothetical protein
MNLSCEGEGAMEDLITHMSGKRSSNNSKNYGHRCRRSSSQNPKRLYQAL